MCQRCPDTHFVSDVLVPHHSRAFMQPLSHAISGPPGTLEGGRYRAISRRDREPRLGTRHAPPCGMRLPDRHSLRTMSAALRSTKSAVKILSVNAPSARGPRRGRRSWTYYG